ncbi:TPA: hypothetical protein L4S01_001568 [Pseudomonas aeruginosa]|nr:hypothetical protein [Pseudomonas aeruginosa]
MTTFPFTTDIDRLAERLDDIPIDPNVPFAAEFRSLLAGTAELWGPQATERSKLATRLHFAGWSRSELESVGLKPKDVENFRRKYKLTAGSAGRPKVKARANAGASESSTIKEILATAEARRADLTVQIQQKRMEGEKLEQELLQIEEAIKALQS